MVMVMLQLRLNLLQLLLKLKRTLDDAIARAGHKRDKFQIMPLIWKNCKLGRKGR